MDAHLTSIVKLFETTRYQHDLYTVFGDWCECAAISLSNAVDLSRRDKREARYMEIVARYDRKTLDLFPKIMGELVLALEAAPADILGQVFHALELHSKAKGQFFTPYSICQLMARMTIDPDMITQSIEKRGYLLAQAPAVGAGVMIIALVEEMRDDGFNYQQCLHVTANDIDRRAVRMAYIQFTLLHIPAVFIEGDTLRLQMIDEWRTCAHILGGWDWKLKTRRDAFEEHKTSTSVPRNMERRPEAICFAADKRGQLNLS
ncbi:N-6 DNA methylase [Rhizobium sp. C4]|uniref:N-6 DNA methylase n=1 Tax=Rhizobium sp. C4 TaxID=1349800 RepID=UPI001E48A372|nr:N-6 DNA methylase [Rhizobium sp. C4]MCD2175952.1 N-6 DNA methylase [Rhizobium sp. C4]